MRTLRASVMLMGMCALMLLALTALAAALPAGFQDVLVWANNDQLTAVRFAPDGHVFLAQKFGVIIEYDSVQDTTPTTFVDIQSKVDDSVDRGLLSVAVDPDFPTKPYVYALYSTNVTMSGTPLPQTGGRVSRFTFDSATGKAVPGSEVAILEGWCHIFPSHAIADMRFGPDGMLYVSAGEGGDYDNVDYGQSPIDTCGDPALEGGALRSQDIETSGDPADFDGAILRIDPATGAAAPGNPFINDPDLAKRRIIAYGLRNPFRINFDANGGLWIADNGWNEWEEINYVPSVTDSVVENFGWPCFEGDFHQNGYDSANLPLCEWLYANGSQTGVLRDPWAAFSHDLPEDASSSTGMVVYTGNTFPAAYEGAVFFADFAAGFAGRPTMYVFLDNGSGPDPTNKIVFNQAAQFVTDLELGPDGNLYYTNFRSNANDEVRRIQYSAPTAAFTATPTSGDAPLQVLFNASTSSDYGTGTIAAYAWDLDGDGQFDDGTGITAQMTYVNEGVYHVTLRVTDDDGFMDTASTTITAGSPPSNLPPIASITSPSTSFRYAAGDIVHFTGSAFDPESGTLPPEAYAWEANLQHCQFDNESDCHFHTLGAFAGVETGAFLAIQHEYPSYATLSLTATELPWWNTGWNLRRAVRFDTAGYTQDLIDFPVLVKLSPANFDYSLVKTDGSDLRFVDPNNTPLAYQIESWNTSGTSFIWVRVPRVNAQPGDYIWLYYNNPSANDAQQPSVVWSNTFQSVLHMNLAGTDVPDMKNNGFPKARNGVSATPGLIGPALHFDGVNDFIDSQLYTNYDNTSWSISLWAKLDPSLVCDEFDATEIEGTNLFVKDWDYRIYLKESCKLGFITGRIDQDPTNNITKCGPNTPPCKETQNFEVGDFADRQWHQVTYEWNKDLGTTFMYVDGSLAATNTSQTSIASNGESYHIGGEGSAHMYFPGTMDEVTVATAARGADWADASYRMVTGNFVSFGPVQTKGVITGSPLPSDVDVHDVLPQTVNVTFESLPSGLQITAYGRNMTAPFTRTIIVNSSVGVSAVTPQFLLTTQYLFSSWSDAGSQSHDVIIDAAYPGLQATFVPASGSLTVHTSPSNANVVVGLLSFLTDGNGDLVVPVIQAGNYTVTVSKTGFTTQTSTIAVDPAENESLNVTLSAVTSSRGGGGGGGSRRSTPTNSTNSTGSSDDSRSGTTSSSGNAGNSGQSAGTGSSAQSGTSGSAPQQSSDTEQNPPSDATGAVVGGGTTSWLAGVAIGLVVIAGAVALYLRRK